MNFPIPFCVKLNVMSIEYQKEKEWLKKRRNRKVIFGFKFC